MILENWKQTAIEVTGKDHLALNEVCQDRTYYVKNNGVHVIALADGAGSRKRSEIGAMIVTKKISEFLVKNFYNVYMGLEKSGKTEAVYLEELKTFKKFIINILVNELNNYPNVPLNELSSTLLFFAIKDDKYIVGHIGDGVIGGVFEESETLTIETLSEPHNGGAPNITFFVTDSDAYENLRISSGEAINLRGVILMSDGPAEVMYHKDYGLDENVIKIFENFERIVPDKYEQILKTFLVERIAKFSSDDLSLNILFLESILANNQEQYDLNLLKTIKAKTQISFKSQYCVHIDSSIKPNTRDFLTLDELRRYLKWQ